MRLGIDLGTTRTVVAWSDRGNYPVVSFEDDGGDAAEHFPSLVAARDGVQPGSTRNWVKRMPSLASWSMRGVGMPRTSPPP